MQVPESHGIGRSKEGPKMCVKLPSDSQVYINTSEFIITQVLDPLSSTGWHLDRVIASAESNKTCLYWQKVSDKSCSGLGKRQDLREDIAIPFPPSTFSRALIKMLWLLLTLVTVGNLTFGFWDWKQAQLNHDFLIEIISCSSQVFIISVTMDRLLLWASVSSFMN